MKMVKFGSVLGVMALAGGLALAGPYDIVNGGANGFDVKGLNIHTNKNGTAFKIDGSNVFVKASELNILNGLAATTANLNSGVASATANLVSNNTLKVYCATAIVTQAITVPDGSIHAQKLTSATISNANLAVKCITSNKVSDVEVVNISGTNYYMWKVQ